MADPTQSRPPRGLTPEAREARIRFDRKYAKALLAARRVALNVLVWGQNPERRTALAAPTRRIRDTLLELGHNPMFSEDIGLPTELGPSVSTSEKGKEFAQAIAADLVFVLLEDAPGALAEAHDFGNHPELASKMYVMIPRAYEEGYSARGAIKLLEDAYGNVFWYDPQDIESCKLLERAVARAEALRQLRHHFIQDTP